MERSGESRRDIDGRGGSSLESLRTEPLSTLGRRYREERSNGGMEDGRNEVMKE